MISPFNAAFTTVHVSAQHSQVNVNYVTYKKLRNSGHCIVSVAGVWNTSKRSWGKSCRPKKHSSIDPHGTMKHSGIMSQMSLNNVRWTCVNHVTFSQVATLLLVFWSLFSHSCVHFYFIIFSYRDDQSVFFRLKLAFWPRSAQTKDAMQCERENTKLKENAWNNVNIYRR